MDNQKKSEAIPHILIVDDNITNLKILSDMLIDEGYKVRKAINGILALKALEIMNFDLILLDITMPEMDGYETCQKIKNSENFSHIPIIFISALNTALDKVKAFQVGGADYITKPFQIEEVIARVENQIKIVNLYRELEETNQQLQNSNKQLEIRQHSFKKTQEQLLQNSLRDPITNLNNRITFIGKLRKLLNNNLENNNNYFALLMIKCINTNMYGKHLSVERENKCLQEISQRLVKTVSPSSILSYLSDHEFAVIIKEANELNNIIEKVELILQQLNLPVMINKQEISLNFHCGVILQSIKYQSYEQILSDVYYALNRAQILKNNYQVFDDDCKAKAQIELRLRKKLKQVLSKQITAINYQPIIPLSDYQPIISLSTEKVSGFFSDIAWGYSNESTISLRKIAEIARDLGMINKLNNVLFIENLKFIREWQELLIWGDKQEMNFDSEIYIKIELSTPQFLHADLLGQITDAIAQTSVQPNHILLEIPEMAILNNPDSAQKITKDLDQLSLRLGIDNLSTNYYYLNNQYNFPITNLTINRFMQQKNRSEEDDIAIYEAIIAMAHNLGMTVTVKDIENAKQLEIFKTLEVDFGHGPWISQLN